jgi:hypothetical protein
MLSVPVSVWIVIAVSIATGSGTAGAHEFHDLAERAQTSDLIGLNLRRVGELFLQCAENFHALDRVDAEVRVELHV